MKLGILGGTFDPIHYGHLFVAEEAHVLFGLEQVWFIPNGMPPHRPLHTVTHSRHRYSMALIALHNNPDFVCSPMEIQRSGLSYTVETLLRLKVERPGDEFYYIVGVDAVADLLSWHRHEEIVRMANLIAVTRPGYPLATLQKKLPAAYLQRILPLNTSSPAISSTFIRERVRKNLPIRYLLPDGVVNYIYQNRLYIEPADPGTGENE